MEFIFPATNDHEFELIAFTGGKFSFCPTGTLDYTLEITSPTSEQVTSSAAAFTFDSSTLKLTASGSTEYLDSSGARYEGAVEFRLCANNEAFC